MFNNELKKNALEELKRTKSRHDSQLDSTVKMVEEFHNSKLAARDIAQRVAVHLETLSGVPKEYAKEISDIKINLQDFTTEVDRLEREFDDNNGGSIAGAGAVMGAGVAAFGPTAAMAIATTFGTASTGAAIGTLSGAAATNAALAWLGGGALVAGGGGVAAGEALLAMAGPVGWAIGGLALLGGGLWASSKNKEAAQKYEAAAREVKSAIYELKKLETAVEKENIRLNSMVQELEIADSSFEWVKEEEEVVEDVGFFAKLFGKKATKEKIKGYRRFERLSSDEKKDLMTIMNTAKTISKILKEKVNKG